MHKNKCELIFDSFIQDGKGKLQKPQFDLIMAVDDLEEFHKLNLEQNKEHYTMFVRFTGGKILNQVQKRGAKIHFNEVYLPKDYDPESDHDNSLQIVSKIVSRFNLVFVLNNYSLSDTA